MSSDGHQAKQPLVSPDLSVRCFFPFWLRAIYSVCNNRYTDP